MNSAKSVKRITISDDQLNQVMLKESKRRSLVLLSDLLYLIGNELFETEDLDNLVVVNTEAGRVLGYIEHEDDDSVDVDIVSPDTVLSDIYVAWRQIYEYVNGRS